MSSSAISLLMLEDNPEDVELSMHVLRKAGLKFTSIVASNKEEFLRAIVENSFDVILSDHSLPQFNSINALTILQKRGDHTPFILVTGAVSEEFAVNVLQLGAFDYILKNNLGRLPSAIERAIEQRRTLTEKRLAEDALKRSEEKYRLLFETSPLPILVIDPGTFACLGVNKAAICLYGYTAGEFNNITVLDLFHENEREKFIDRLSSVDGPLPANPEIWTHETKDGRIVNTEMEIRATLFEDDNAVLVQVIDVTSKIKADIEIKKVNRQLRRLSAHLQKVREEERMKISREIHDELWQQLTVIKNESHWIRRTFKPENKDMEERLENLFELIRETTKSVARIYTNIRPGMLDDLGLVDALQWQSREVEKRETFKVNFTSENVAVSLPVMISSFLFRVYQEALSNVVKHADASEVNSRLAIAGDKIFLEICDNGKGMDPNIDLDEKGFGLLGIKEQIREKAGIFEIDSSPGVGTRLSVGLPLLDGA